VEGQGKADQLVIIRGMLGVAALALGAGVAAAQLPPTLEELATLRALAEAGADVRITDREGMSPLAHARRRGYVEMVTILERVR
jgi:hypothetical protein